MAKVKHYKNNDAFFERAKRLNGGKPPVLLGVNIELTKENWEKSQNKVLTGEAKSNYSQPSST